MHLVKNAPVTIKLPRRPSVPYFQATGGVEQEQVEEEEMVEEGEKVEDTDDDDDDIFENTYANLDLARHKAAPPAEQEQQTYANVQKKIYANVQNLVKEKIKEISPRKFRKLGSKGQSMQERRPPTPNDLDLSAIDDDELFSASEVAPELESEDGRTVNMNSLRRLTTDDRETE